MLPLRTLVARSAALRNGVLGRKKFSPTRQNDLRRTHALLRVGQQSLLRRYQSSAATSDLAASRSSATKKEDPTHEDKPLNYPWWSRWAIWSSLTTLSFFIGIIMTTSSAASEGEAIRNPPTDAETLSLYTPDNDEQNEIDTYIFKHPVTQALIHDEKYIMSRPHLKIPPAMRALNLTGGTLLGKDKIEVPPLQFSTADGSTFASIQYLGPALCGHPGIIHGGLLATLLDEGLARCCFPALPNKVAVTASLKVDYRRPCMASQYVILRAETTKVDGRKAWVKGRIETLVDESKGEKPEVLVEAEALFIEPKNAAAMTKLYTPA